MDEMREEYDFSQGTRGAVLHHDGETCITLWVDDEVLEWFRSTAEREGRYYLIAIRTALRYYMEQENHKMVESLKCAIDRIHIMYRNHLKKLDMDERKSWQEWMERLKRSARIIFD